MKALFHRIQLHIGGINGVLMSLYCSFVFLTYALLSESFSVYYIFIAFLIITAASFFFCPMLLRLMAKFQLKHTDNRIGSQKRSDLITRLIFFLIPLGVYLLYYITFYPGGFSPDCIDQYIEATNNTYSDWHPATHTLFAFKLPLLLTGGWIGSIVLFQVLFLSVVLGYSFYVIYMRSNLKFTAIAMAFVLLHPQLGYYLMFPWKDVTFGIGALLLLTYALQIVCTKGQWIRRPINTVLFTVVLVFTTLVRHNAVLFTAPLMLALLLWLTKKRGLIICLSALVLFCGIKFPVYHLLGVEQPDQRQVETLGLPMTVIGAVVTYDPDALDEETREFAYKVAPVQVWEERYIPGSYNNVKWDLRTDNLVIEEYGAVKVLSMMFRCFINSPVTSMRGLIKLTEGLYTLSDPHHSLFYPHIISNDFSITQAGIERLQVISGSYSVFVTETFPKLSMYLGVVHFLLIAAVLSKFKLNKLKDWKRILLILSVFCYNFGSALLLTGVDDTIRFFFYTYMLVPVLLALIYHTERTADAVACETE